MRVQPNRLATSEGGAFPVGHHRTGGDPRRPREQRIDAPILAQHLAARRLNRIWRVPPDGHFRELERNPHDFELDSTGGNGGWYPDPEDSQVLTLASQDLDPSLEEPDWAQHGGT